MTGIVERLRERAKQQVEERGDYLYKGQADPELEESAALIEELVEGLRPFADCVEQIADTEDDEEWAKFRLLIKDYRRAKAVVAKVKGEE